MKIIKNNLNSIMKNDILHFFKDNKEQNICKNCCESNFYINDCRLNNILEDGICSNCKQKQKIFNPIVFKNIIIRYGLSDFEYFYIKNKIDNL